MASPNPVVWYQLGFLTEYRTYLDMIEIKYKRDSLVKEVFHDIMAPSE